MTVMDKSIEASKDRDTLEFRRVKSITNFIKKTILSEYFVFYHFNFCIFVFAISNLTFLSLRYH